MLLHATALLASNTQIGCRLKSDETVWSLENCGCLAYDYQCTITETDTTPPNPTTMVITQEMFDQYYADPPPEYLPNIPQDCLSLYNHYKESIQCAYVTACYDLNTYMTDFALFYDNLDITTETVTPLSLISSTLTMPLQIDQHFSVLPTQDETTIFYESCTTTTLTTIPPDFYTPNECMAKTIQRNFMCILIEQIPLPLTNPDDTQTYSYAFIKLSNTHCPTDTHYSSYKPGDEIITYHFPPEDAEQCNYDYFCPTSTGYQKCDFNSYNPELASWCGFQFHSSGLFSVTDEFINLFQCAYTSYQNTPLLSPVMFPCPENTFSTQPFTANCSAHAYSMCYSDINGFEQCQEHNLRVPSQYGQLYFFDDNNIISRTANDAPVLYKYSDCPWPSDNLTMINYDSNDDCNEKCCGRTFIPFRYHIGPTYYQAPVPIINIRWECRHYRVQDTENPLLYSSEAIDCDSPDAILQCTRDNCHSQYAQQIRVAAVQYDGQWVSCHNLLTTEKTQNFFYNIGLTSILSPERITIAQSQIQVKCGAFAGFMGNFTLSTPTSCNCPIEFLCETTPWLPSSGPIDISSTPLSDCGESTGFPAGNDECIGCVGAPGIQTRKVWCRLSNSWVEPADSPSCSGLEQPTITRSCTSTVNCASKWFCAEYDPNHSFFMQFNQISSENDCAGDAFYDNTIQFSGDIVFTQCFVYDEMELSDTRDKNGFTSTTCTLSTSDIPYYSLRSTKCFIYDEDLLITDEFGVIDYTLAIKKGQEQNLDLSGLCSQPNPSSSLTYVPDDEYYIERAKAPCATPTSQCHISLYNLWFSFQNVIIDPQNGIHVHYLGHLLEGDSSTVSYRAYTPGYVPEQFSVHLEYTVLPIVDMESDENGTIYPFDWASTESLDASLPQFPWIPLETNFAHVDTPQTFKLSFPTVNPSSGPLYVLLRLLMRKVDTHAIIAYHYAPSVIEFIPRITCDRLQEQGLCEKNTQSGMSCQNGPDGGKCICLHPLDGSQITSTPDCSRKMSCDAVSFCKNGGYLEWDASLMTDNQCSDVCTCPHGYSGHQCDACPKSCNPKYGIPNLNTLCECSSCFLSFVGPLCDFCTKYGAFNITNPNLSTALLFKYGPVNPSHPELYPDVNDDSHRDLTRFGLFEAQLNQFLLSVMYYAQGYLSLDSHLSRYDPVNDILQIVVKFHGTCNITTSLISSEKVVLKNLEDSTQNYKNFHSDFLDFSHRSPVINNAILSIPNYEDADWSWSALTRSKILSSAIGAQLMDSSRGSTLYLYSTLATPYTRSYSFMTKNLGEYIVCDTANKDPVCKDTESTPGDGGGGSDGGGGDGSGGGPTDGNSTTPIIPVKGKGQKTKAQRVLTIVVPSFIGLFILAVIVFILFIHFVRNNGVYTDPRFVEAHDPHTLIDITDAREPRPPKASHNLL